MSEVTDEALSEIGVDLVLSMMASVSSDKIGAMDWWPRAKSALETAADAASNWPHMVSKMASKLQIDATMVSTATNIAAIGKDLSEQNLFERFRKVCRRDAVFIVAMSQAKRDEQKKAKKDKAKFEDLSETDKEKLDTEARTKAQKKVKL